MCARIHIRIGEPRPHSSARILFAQFCTLITRSVISCEPAAAADFWRRAGNARTLANDDFPGVVTSLREGWGEIRERRRVHKHRRRYLCARLVGGKENCGSLKFAACCAANLKFFFFGEAGVIFHFKTTRRSRNAQTNACYFAIKRRRC